MCQFAFPDTAAPVVESVAQLKGLCVKTPVNFASRICAPWLSEHPESVALIVDLWVAAPDSLSGGENLIVADSEHPTPPRATDADADEAVNVSNARPTAQATTVR